MAYGDISWLGNPVVDGNISRKIPYNATLVQTVSKQAPQTAAPSPATIPVQNQNVAPGIPNLVPGAPLNQEGPPPVTDIGYIPNYLMKNIGKNIKAEFIINTAQYEKTGRLIAVGVNYFVLEDVNSRTNIMCDLYSVKFITVIV